MKLFCCCCTACKQLHVRQTERAPLHVQGATTVHRRNNYMSEHRHQYQHSSGSVHMPEPLGSPINDRLVKSLEYSRSASLTPTDQTADFRKSGSQRLPTKQEHKVVGEGAYPQLDCFIIPSYGKDPPDNVAVKKMAGDFLKGVGDDFEIIKQLIKNDSGKDLYDVEIMCHFAQKRPIEFTKTIESAMIDLKMKRKGCKFIDIVFIAMYVVD